MIGRKDIARFACGAGLGIAMTLGGAMPALAANGVQKDDNGNVITYTATSDNGVAKADGSLLNEDGSVAQGVHLVYDTTGGSWYDPGKDPTVPGTDKDQTGTAGEDTDEKHDNGTFVIIVPKEIKYTGMKVGTVDTSDEYDVYLAGVIEAGKSVELTTSVTNPKVDDNNELEATLERSELTDAEKDSGKKVFSATELTNGFNDDKSLKGQTLSHTLKMKGTASVSGTYEGSVIYTATVTTS